MIDKSIFELFELTEQTEKQLWEYAIIVFDSSALLNFYDIPKETRQKIYKTFEGRLKDRILLPGHVQLEYLKNRKKTIYAPLDGNTKNVNYSTIEKLHLVKINAENKKIKNSISEINKIIEEVSKATKKPDRHPHLDADLFTDLSSSLSRFEENYSKFGTNKSEFEAKIKNEIQNIKGEIKQLENNDDVLDALNKFFISSKDYSFSEKNKIAEEGQIRYNQTIPPGYNDNEKEGHQKFGDYFIWRQILDYAKKNNKSVIFICDDITKYDWCIPDKYNPGRIKYPRPELSKEFFEETGYKFWMYSLNQWPHYSNLYLETDLNEDYFKTDYSDIDQSVVNLRDIAFRTMKDIEANKIRKKISPSILNVIVKNLDDYSQDSIYKLKSLLSNNLSSYFNAKRILQASVDFSEDTNQRAKYEEDLNDLYPEILDLENSIAYLDYYITENHIPF